MHKIDVKELFQRLNGFEYELLKYINRTQGAKSAPVNFYEAATALSAENADVRRACKRLVESKVLIVEGENFKINEEIFKKDS